MWAMIVGIFSSNLWAPPQGIGQAIGIGVQGHDFQIAPFFAGLIGHMMNSVILGAIFIAIALALRLHGGLLVIGGMVWGLIVYAVMFWLILRGLLTGTNASFLSSNPEWAWVVGHLMFGAILGALVAYGPLATHDQAAGRRPALA
jgi:hypothetical protein